MSDPRFGISTHVFHEWSLTREHLVDVAGQGFEALELFATRTHFDYHNPANVGSLQVWLAEAGLELAAVHAPITDGFIGGRFGAPFVLSSSDPAVRAAAVAETVQALHIARRIPFGVGGEGTLIYFVARLEKPKQPLLLPDIAVALEHMLPNADWKIIVAGEGGYRAAVERKIAALGIGHRIRLVGEIRRLPRASVDAHLDRGDAVPVHRPRHARNELRPRGN